MKALVAAFAAVSLSVLCAEPVSARGMRGSGQSGRAGLSHSSGRPAHSSGSPAHFGRSGAHLKLGGHPFHGHRFGHHRHFKNANKFQIYLARSLRGRKKFLASKTESRIRKRNVVLSVR